VRVSGGLSRSLFVAEDRRREGRRRKEVVDWRGSEDNGEDCEDGVVDDPDSLSLLQLKMSCNWMLYR